MRLIFTKTLKIDSGGSIRMEASNPEVSAKNGELVLCNINMDSSGGDF